VAAELINTYNPAKLDEYFRIRYRRPTQWPWFGDLDDASGDLSAGGIKVSIPGARLLRGVTKAGRYKRAAWQWLNPRTPVLTLKDIPTLMQRSGLGHVSEGDFLKNLLAQCDDVQKNHPPLGRWIARRRSLITFRTEPPAPFPDKLVDTETSLGRVQNVAIMYATAGKLTAEQADTLSESALLAAAQAAQHILSSTNRRCRFSANLMVPLTLTPSRRTSGFGITALANQNHRKATEVWGQLPEDVTKCLAIVSETTDGGHMGFWIPLWKTLAGYFMPGAANAYHTTYGQTVFKDDLPDLVDLGFKQDLRERWKNYLVQHLRERMFVSVPLRMPSSYGSEHATVAVLNINSDPDQDDGWIRGYHREWLESVERVTKRFTEIAYYCYGLKSAAFPDQYPALDTGSREWNKLREIRAMALPGPTARRDVMNGGQSGG
jgi:hypothetical protein